MTDAEIRPFRIDVPREDLDGIHDRLGRTRWPDLLVEDIRGFFRRHR